MPPRKPGPPVRAAPPLLELRDAIVVRDGGEILHVDRLILDEGERVAVLGPNGSGKSTLVGLHAHDVHPVARPGGPPAVLRGKELWDLLDARALFGVVTNAWQELHARPVTVRDAVLSGFFGSVGLTSFQQVTGKHASAGRRAMREVGIAHLADRTMATLSTGEARGAHRARPRTRPARARPGRAVRRARPDGALALRRTVRALAGSGRGLLLVTHHIEDIPPEVTRVVMLRRGPRLRRRPEGGPAHERRGSPSCSRSRPTSRSATASTACGQTRSDPFGDGPENVYCVPQDELGPHRSHPDPFVG